MRQIRFLIFIIICFVLIFILAASEPPPSFEVSEEEKAELALAFTQKIQSKTLSSPVGMNIFTPELDSAYKTIDGSLALLWLALRDNAGRIVATEPGLAIAQKIEDEWQIFTPGDSEWEELFSALPEELLPLEQRPVPKDINLDELSQPEALSGYYLPYAAGTKQWLEGSISHFQNIPELGYPSCGIDVCRYAYDFTNDFHFPLLASKDGYVLDSRDSCNDGNPYCTNYMVIKDTNNQTYQLYLHLANGTIPDKLTDGTFVKRGQYIGDTDDTGYSTSNHVHFMVVDSLWFNYDSQYYWGRSIDVRFADVPINGGIPRTCYEVTNFQIYDGATNCLGDRNDPRNPNNDWFVSGNVGAYPPSGTLTRPISGAIVASGDNPLIDVTAIASDDVHVEAVRLMAKLSNQWVDIGDRITNTNSNGEYDWDVNLCQYAPVNGGLEVALKVWDHEGNVAFPLNPRTIQVDHACPPPSSSLNSAEGYDSTATRLTWSATSSGVAIGSFEIQWRTDPGTWANQNVMSISGSKRVAWFVGQFGGKYAFRIRAKDINGQTEPWPAGDIAETTVNLPATCVPDGYEEDDNDLSSYVMSLGEIATRNICGLEDPDWFKVNIVEPGYYQISTHSLNGGAAVNMTVYNGDTKSVVTSGGASGVGENSMFIFLVENPGLFYLKSQPVVTELAGSQAQYNIQVLKVSVVFLPVVSR